MSAPKRDWETEVRNWLAMKSHEPHLTAEEFYRRRGLPKRRARTAIGKRLAAEWRKIQAGATARVQEQTEINLSEELLNILRINRGLIAQGAEAALTRKGKKRLTPKKYLDAVEAIRAGTRGTFQVIKLLTGNEPLMPKTEVEPIFMWNEPKQISAPRKKSNGKKKRKKPKKKSK